MSQRVDVAFRAKDRCDGDLHCVCVCDSGYAATALQKAQVRIINHSVCNDLMDGAITSRMLCAGVLSGGVDACQVMSPSVTSFFLYFSLFSIWFLQKSKKINKYSKISLKKYGNRG